MFDTRKFGAFLARLRKNADMTQSELAIKLNLTRQAISKYELGDSFPDISTLVEIARIFNISLNDLINSGDPTANEAQILMSAASGSDVPVKYDIKDLINVAPLLKPSVLDRLSRNLRSYGVDLTNLVNLVQYLSDERIYDLIQNADINTLSFELLEKLILFLDEDSRLAVFEKVLDGELDWRFVLVMYPYIEYMSSLVEAAVMEGYLPKEALRMLWEYKKKDGREEGWAEIMTERLNFLWDSKDAYDKWKQSIGKRSNEYIKDLNLELIFEEICSISSFSDFSNHKNIFFYPCSDLSTIRYRQSIIKELYENEKLFVTCKEFTFMLRDIQRKLKTANSSSDELKKKIYILQLYHEFQNNLRVFHGRFNKLASKNSIFGKLADYISAYARSEYMAEEVRRLGCLLSRLDGLYSFEIILNKKEEHQIFSAAVFDPEDGADFCKVNNGKGLNISTDGGLYKTAEGERRISFSDRLKAASEFILEDYDFDIRIYQDIDITALDKELQIRAVNKDPDILDEIDGCYLNHKDFFFYDFFNMADDLIFYISYIEFMRLYEEAGFYFTLPVHSADGRHISIEGAYDLSLGINRYKSIKCYNLVANSCSFDENNRIFILTGANQGGKTTYLRSIGIIQCMYQTGVYVPAASACLSVANQVYTHFSQADDAAVGAGRFEKELVLLQRILAEIKANDIFLLNEPFTSTQRSIAVVLLAHALLELGNKGSYGGMVTHFYEILKRLPASPYYSLVTLVNENESFCERTYRIEKRPADNKSHAGDIARKCGVGYTQLLENIKVRL